MTALTPFPRSILGRFLDWPAGCKFVISRCKRKSQT